MNLLLRNNKGNNERLSAVIIDDTRIIREKIKEYLAENTSVLVLGEAGNVKDGVHMLSSLNPDIVFLDIKLGDENGLSVLLHLKKNKSQTKVIIFSNSSDSYYKRVFSENGCDYFLDKSKDFKLIPEVVHQIRAKKNNLHSKNNLHLFIPSLSGGIENTCELISLRFFGHAGIS
jgi:DNA-binding NarL/FixJ family response regulator